MDVTRMAQFFGLGSKTGINGLDSDAESAGSIPQPQSLSDAVNQSIGQGKMLVTPLQVADFVAAVGNGGTLYVPNLIEKIAPPDGDPSYVFAPKVRGTLAVSAENLKYVQDAMRSVVANKRGTAYYVLANLSWVVTGKTGTAQTSTDMPHAWFAGYSMANDPKHPDIAVAIIAENAGEGADIAAPIYRRVMSLYFSDGTNSGGVLPWEARPYVVASPTSNVTDTPTTAPADTETPTPTP
jgi:penicillin-binding protein 2